MRVVDKAMALSEDVAELLFERLAPFLQPEPATAEDLEVGAEGDSRSAEGIVNGGEADASSSRWEDGNECFGCASSACWVAAGLNPTFRICRYGPGGFFAPHQVAHVTTFNPEA